MSDELYTYKLEIILEHLDVVQKRFSKVSIPADFVASEEGKMLLDSIVTRLQAIGENTKTILAKKWLDESEYPEIHWDRIVRFRDFISHHYEMLDYEIVFEICKNYLPSLQLVISKELHK
ncbi:HepT-like ribonuclease domain-containing protein [Flavobacterium sp.]|uniref:HepT-like ribonuclease domain-containing protein n=1 Tax=Flavobacterium sp. TaxID=239 RepID=UPI0025B9F666|nr:HepT-like ribonuclease domain-containing protein [Flavobacterium sp.]MBA4154838.1 toxin-antitoxin system antitoxin subunit [Flavobacterium sp.]